VDLVVQVGEVALEVGQVVPRWPGKEASHPLTMTAWPALNKAACRSQVAQIEMAKKEGTSTRTTTTSIWRRAQGAVVTLIAAPLT